MRLRIINISLLVILAILTVSVNAKLEEPWKYKEGECELVAKEYQRIYGGYLIFIQPLKENGAFDIGPYNGAFINKAYNKDRGIYYIDYMSQSYFNNTNEILDWYYKITGKRSVIYNINEEHLPFVMIWYY